MLQGKFRSTADRQSGTLKPLAVSDRLMILTINWPLSPA
jgi:hypothetical protein